MAIENHYDWCNLLCYSLYSHSHLLLLTRKKERGNVCFCFATKLFLMMTNFFLWAQKASLTNVHINTFSTMCTKQATEKKRKKEKAKVSLRDWSQNLKGNLSKRSTWRLPGCLGFWLSVSYSSSALKEEKPEFLLTRSTTDLTWKETQPVTWHEWAHSQFSSITPEY